MLGIFKKILSILLLFSLLSVSGCSKTYEPTVDSLFTSSNKIYNDSKSVSMMIDIDVDGKKSFTYSDAFVDISLDLDLDIDSDSNGTCIDGDVNMDIFKIEQEYPLIRYYQISDNGTTEYSYDNNTESWIKSEVNKMVNMFEAGRLDYSSIYSKLLLDVNTVRFNDIDAYHVYGYINGNDCIEILSNLVHDLSLDGFEDVDLSKFNIYTDFYFSKKDSRLLGVELDLTSTDFSSISNSDIVTSSAIEPNEYNLGLSFEEFKIKVVFDSINKYTFKVPNDVIEESTDKVDIFNHTNK